MWCAEGRSTTRTPRGKRRILETTRGWCWISECPPWPSSRPKRCSGPAPRLVLILDRSDVWETAFCKQLCGSVTWHVFDPPPTKVYVARLSFSRPRALAHPLRSPASTSAAVSLSRAPSPPHPLTSLQGSGSWILDAARLWRVRAPFPLVDVPRSLIPPSLPGL